MKVLLCHNYYQVPGGEDRVFADEARLLQTRGHQVVRFTRHNHTIEQLRPWDAARCAVWNGRSYAALRRLIRQQRPEIVHCTNTFPLISPAAYYAARAEGIPVVQSLHNYRLFCANALFLRDGQQCEQCLRRPFAWPAVVHGCYRHSRAASTVVATMLGVHRLGRTWSRLVDCYIALTDFSRRKFVEGGLPGEKVFVKPNFIEPDPGPGKGRGGYAAFVGRLSQEKGIQTLLAAWERLPRQVPLRIVGDGPLRPLVQQAAQRNPNVRYLGRLSPEEVLSVVGEALCLVFPSQCYETFGRAIIEAYSRGTPVVASRLGAMVELVDEGRTGLHFEPGNPDELASKIAQLVDDPGHLARMRQAARDEYRQKYTAEANYQRLLAVYRQAGRSADCRPARPTRVHSRQQPAQMHRRRGPAVKLKS